MINLEEELRTLFTRVAHSANVPPMPDLTASDPSNETSFDELFEAASDVPDRKIFRRHRALVGVAALAILGGGLSIAAAAGLPVLPGAIVRILGWDQSPGTYHADPATARVLLSIPGPNGAHLSLWYADANHNGYCVSLSAAVAGHPGAVAPFSVNPKDEPRNGVGVGGCSGKPDTTSWRTFGGDFWTASNAESTTFIVHVPQAAAVLLELDDGTTIPMKIGDAWTAGWISERERRLHPVLVGVASDGIVVGTFPIPVGQ